MIEIRLRTKSSKEYLDSVKQHILGPADVDVLLTGPARVMKPDNRPLCIYLPKAIPEDINEDAYPILHTIRGLTTNRGMASGSQRVVPKHLSLDPDRKRYRSYAKPVASSLIGMVPGGEAGTGGAEVAPEHRYCRLTAWTGKHLPQWQALQPYFRVIAQHFAEQVPERYAAQMREVAKTNQEWVLPGTPFTTVTVNASYPTGTHLDDGDLKEGFSCLSVLRRGTYTGGFLTFPEYRVAINMQDRDLLLMDAHEWHGNTQMLDKRGEPIDRTLNDAERISVVSYFRTAAITCGTYDEEIAKANRITSKL